MLRFTQRFSEARGRFSQLNRQLTWSADSAAWNHTAECRYLVLPPSSHSLLKPPCRRALSTSSETFTSEWCPLSVWGETLYEFAVPMEILCCPPCSPVLQQRPEMAVDKQWEQTVTPTSIDLAPLPHPFLLTTPHWFHLHSIYMKSPLPHLPFLPGLTKVINDQPLPPSATTSLCLALAVRGTTNLFLPADIQKSELPLFSDM